MKCPFANPGEKPQTGTKMTPAECQPHLSHPGKRTFQYLPKESISPWI